MTKEQLESIRAREKAASPGPWESHMLGGGKGGPNRYAVRGPTGSFSIATVQPQQNASTPKAMLSGGWNSSFIAHARTDIPLLLAEIDRLSGIESAAIKLREGFEALKKEQFEKTVKKWPTQDEWEGLGAGIDMTGLIRALDGRGAK